MANPNKAKKITNTGRLGLHLVKNTVRKVIRTSSSKKAVDAVKASSLDDLAKLHNIATISVNCETIDMFTEKYFMQSMNTNKEEAYWRDKYKNRAYIDSIIAYDSYAPAYRFGIDAYYIYTGYKFEEIETKLSRHWENARGRSRLNWDIAKIAARDAYERLYNLNEYGLNNT